MRQLTHLAIRLFVMLIILAACDNGNIDTVTQAPEGNDAVMSFEVENGVLRTTAFTIDVPDGWIAMAGEGAVSDVILIANSADINAQTPFDGLADEDALVAIYYFQDGMSLLGEEDNAEVTVADAVNLLLSESSTYDLENSESLTINGQDAVLLSTLEEDALVYIIEVGEDFYMLLGQTSIGNLTTFEQNLRAIIESIDFD